MPAEVLDLILDRLDQLDGRIEGLRKETRSQFEALRREMLEMVESLRAGQPPRGLCERHDRDLDALWQAHRQLAARVWYLLGLAAALGAAASLLVRFIGG